MTDEHPDIVIRGSTTIEIDAERIAQIIFDACHTSEARAASAANLVVDYLTEVFQNTSTLQ